MKGLTVLLLDDDSRTRLQMARPLKREGCRIIEASDGEDGLAILRGQHVDLAITDVRMPRLGGFGFFAAARLGEGGRPPIAPDVPIILVSGFVTARERARALDAGVDEFLARPFDLDEFLARVRAVVRRFETDDEAPSTTGDLSDLGGTSLTQALHHSRRTCRLRIRADGVQAFLDMEHGRVVHGEISTEDETRVGEPAAIQALGLESGSFTIEPLPPDGPRTITRDTESLLLHAMASADETEKRGDDALRESTTHPASLEIEPRVPTETVPFEEEVWEVDPPPIGEGELAPVGAGDEARDEAPDDAPDDEQGPAVLGPY